MNENIQKQTQTKERKMSIKLDVYHIQIVAHYFKFKSDFINIIQVRKQFQFLLDRFRINPIPITKKNKEFISIS